MNQADRPSLQVGGCDELADDAILSAENRLWAGRTRATVVEDEGPEEDEPQDEAGSADPEYDYDYEWGTEAYDADEFNAISVWDELAEFFLHNTHASGA